MSLESLESCREGNRLEAKLALGGLPHSVWETISAFANTAGGTIVLGVEEARDGALDPVGLQNARKMLDDFWNVALNNEKLSARFLSDDDVRIETVDGKDIIVIEVPWVDRHLRPVYLDGDILGQTFRRAHTGDHRCSREEVLSMLRDAAVSSQDSDIARRSCMEDLDYETVSRYRREFESAQGKHIWNSYGDAEFLLALGAADRGDDGIIRPTIAGLLMFGQDRWITRELPHYFLDYRQETDGAARWQDRFTSQPGDWSGNVYDYFGRVYLKLKQALRVPFKLEGVRRVDETVAHEVLREALANCLTNANYFERRGVVCVWTEDAIVISNPGDFRMPVEEAMKAGQSDPRNETMLKMFSLVHIGERAGSGISKIFSGWKASGYSDPSYEVSYGPDRTVLTLPLVFEGRCPSFEDVDAKSGRKSEKWTQKMDAKAKSGRKSEKWTQKMDAKAKSGRKLSRAEKNRELVVAFVEEKGTASRSQVVDATGLSPSWASKLLGDLVQEGRLARRGEGRGCVYQVAQNEKQ